MSHLGQFYFNYLFYFLYSYIIILQNSFYQNNININTKYIAAVHIKNKTYKIWLRM